MEKLEHFDQSRRAMERSRWMNRQAESMAKMGHDVVSESMKLVHEARKLIPTYRTESE